MKLLLKIIGWIFAGLAGMVAVVVIALLLISDEQYKEWATVAASSATGRELVINGEVNVYIGGQVGFSAKDIRFENTEWGSRSKMARADRLVLKLNLVPLIKGVLDFTLEIDGPRILLEKNEEGLGNWVFKSSEPPSGHESGQEVEKKARASIFPIKPYIRNLEVKDLKIVFINTPDGESLRVDVEILRVYVDGAEFLLHLVADYQGAPIELKGSLGRIVDWHSNLATTIFLEGRLNEALFGISGSVGSLLPQPSAKIALSLKAENVSTFSHFSGASLPDLKDLDISLTVLADGGRFAVEDVNVQLNDHKMELDVTGSIADIFKVSGVDFNAAISSEHLAALFADLNLSLPYSLPSSLKFNAGVQGDLSTLSVTDLNLSVHDQGLDVSLIGAVDNVLTFAGADAELSIRLDSTEIVGQYAGIELPDFGPLEISTKIISPRNELLVESLVVDIIDPAISAHISGSVERIARSVNNKIEISGIDMKAQIDSEQLDSVVKKLGINLPVAPQASASVQASLTGSLDQLSVRDLKAEIRDKGVEINLTGAVDHVLKPAGADAELSIKLDSTEIAGKYAGIELPDFGPLEISAKIISPENEILVESLVVDIADPAISGHISGSVARFARSTDNKIEISGIDIKTQVSSKQLGSVMKKLNIKLPVAPPASASAEASLRGSLDQLSVRDLKAEIRDKGVEINLTGDVENVLGPSSSLVGVAAVVQGTAQSTANLSKFAGIELPDLGSLTLGSKVVSEGETLQLDTLNLQLAGEQLKIELKGVIKDLLALAKATEDHKKLGAAGIDISLKTDAQSVSKLARLAGVEVTELGELRLNSQLRSSDQSLRLEGMTATLTSEGMETKVSATVADLIALEGINATIDAGLDSLSRLSLFTNYELPETGHWALNARAIADDGLDGPTTLYANINGEGIQAVVEATVPDVKAPETFTAKLSIDTASLSRFGVLLNKELPDKGPLKMTGIASAKSGEYRVDEFQVFLDKAVINADLAYTTPIGGDSGRPKLAGNMNVQNLDITPLLAPENDNTEVAAEDQETIEETKEDFTEAEPSSGKKLFSSKPFSVGMLQDHDIDLKFDVANFIIGKGVSVEDFSLGKGFNIEGSTKVTLDQGLLKLGPLNFSGKTGGGGEGVIVLDARNPKANLDVFIDFKDIVLPRYGGSADLDIDLNGSGESMAELMGSLDGRFVAVLEDIELKKSVLTRYGTGVLSQINPMASDTTMLECAIARLDTTDGLIYLDKNIAAQTTEVTWFATGEINLKTEGLDLGIYPLPRKGMKSLTDLGLTKLIHIGGTLADPEIGIDPKDIAKKSASYSAYVATGGIYFLVEKMINKHRANKDQCKQILADLEKDLKKDLEKK